MNEIGMIGMNTYPQFYFLIKLPLRLEPVTLHFNMFMNYIPYYLYNTYYHPKKDRFMIQHL
jgi:hypothetical protein